MNGITDMSGRRSAQQNPVHPLGSDRAPIPPRAGQLSSLLAGSEGRLFEVSIANFEGFESVNGNGYITSFSSDPLRQDSCLIILSGCPKVLNGFE